MYIRKVDEAENKLNQIQAYIEQSNYDTRKEFGNMREKIFIELNNLKQNEKGNFTIEQIRLLNIV